MSNKIYKYISFNSDVQKKIATLKRNAVYMSSPLEFNDPYDCVLSFKLNEIEKMITDKKDRQKIKKERKKWPKRLKFFLIACFTTKWNNFLMWAHYANGHNGICVEYDRNEVKEMADEEDMWFEKVDYIKSITKFNDPDIGEETKKMAIFSKHEQWEYEKEWRIVDANKGKRKNREIDMPTPTALYIGYNVEEWLKNMLIDIAKKIGIEKVYLVKLSQKEYKLKKGKNLLK